MQIILNLGQMYDIAVFHRQKKEKKKLGKHLPFFLLINPATEDQLLSA